MVKLTLALLTATVATVSANAAATSRSRANAGPMQPPMGQVQDFRIYAAPADDSFHRLLMVQQMIVVQEMELVTVGGGNEDKYGDTSNTTGILNRQSKRFKESNQISKSDSSPESENSFHSRNHDQDDFDTYSENESLDLELENISEGSEYIQPSENELNDIHSDNNDGINYIGDERPGSSRNSRKRKGKSEKHERKVKRKTVRDGERRLKMYTQFGHQWKDRFGPLELAYLKASSMRQAVRDKENESESSDKDDLSESDGYKNMSRESLGISNNSESFSDIGSEPLGNLYSFSEKTGENSNRNFNLRTILPIYKRFYEKQTQIEKYEEEDVYSSGIDEIEDSQTIYLDEEDIIDDVVIKRESEFETGGESDNELMESDSHSIKSNTQKRSTPLVDKNMRYYNQLSTYVFLKNELDPEKDVLCNTNLNILFNLNKSGSSKKVIDSTTRIHGISGTWPVKDSIKQLGIDKEVDTMLEGLGVKSVSNGTKFRNTGVRGDIENYEFNVDDDDDNEQDRILNDVLITKKGVMDGFLETRIKNKYGIDTNNLDDEIKQELLQLFSLKRTRKRAIASSKLEESNQDFKNTKLKRINKDVYDVRMPIVEEYANSRAQRNRANYHYTLFKRYMGSQNWSNGDSVQNSYTEKAKLMNILIASHINKQDNSSGGDRDKDGNQAKKKTKNKQPMLKPIEGVFDPVTLTRLFDLEEAEPSLSSMLEEAEKENKNEKDDYLDLNSDLEENDDENYDSSDSFIDDNDTDEPGERKRNPFLNNRCRIYNLISSDYKNNKEAPKYDNAKLLNKYIQVKNERVFDLYEKDLMSRYMNKSPEATNRNDSETETKEACGSNSDKDLAEPANMDFDHSKVVRNQSISTPFLANNTDNDSLSILFRSPSVQTSLLRIIESGNFGTSSFITSTPTVSSFCRANNEINQPGSSIKDSSSTIATHSDNGKSSRVNIQKTYIPSINTSPVLESPANISDNTKKKRYKNSSFKSLVCCDQVINKLDGILDAALCYNRSQNKPRFQKLSYIDIFNLARFVDIPDTVVNRASERVSQILASYKL
ncbi:hypothetical protein AX774_g4470 [Zancudomyces culisetae]|uniref:Uncharacterized protein n=1 Tax=Zancudomyces culisetae TaxID=1213189 RepID=A0A1R1PM58_ZANCU|nr:hypothetical protein AX774_g4470 [Zancudomyces culisetae]|eukprot:OMH82061.1 hypothetical protein AX774_g4470 [Zancudomyces culisetae]